MSTGKSIITRTVWILSIVSFFTDVASEMLYPVMPLYLQKIGFSIALIGILEGFAEATAGLSKGYFGRWSDMSGRRLPFVQLGYLLSAISKPLLAVSVVPLYVFFCRTLDRFGKGLRTGARDAILSGESTTENKGAVFGLHRTFDTLGAALGPAFALVYLFFNPEAYVHLFIISLIPGLLAVGGTFALREKFTSKGSGVERERESMPSQGSGAQVPPKSEYRGEPESSPSLGSGEEREGRFGRAPSFVHTISYWRDSSRAYKRVVIGLLLFAIINSSDVFLLLKCKEAGMSDTRMIGLFIFYNLIYAIFSYPLGRLADRWGLRRVFVMGMMVFSAVYLAIIWATSLYQLAIIFGIYGVYSAATYGVSKAWISNIVPKTETAGAIGTFAGFQSICAMIASSWAGFIWYKFGSDIMFAASGILAFVICFYFMALPAQDIIKSPEDY